VLASVIFRVILIVAIIGYLRLADCKPIISILLVGDAVMKRNLGPIILRQKLSFVCGDEGEYRGMLEKGTFTIL